MRWLSRLLVVALVVGLAGDDSGGIVNCHSTANVTVQGGFAKIVDAGRAKLCFLDA